MLVSNRLKAWCQLMVWGIPIALVSFGQTAFAGGAGGFLTLLEEPKVVLHDNDAEIQVRFTAQVRYLRHFPERKGDTLRIFIELVNPCVAEQLHTQEQKKYSEAKDLVPFNVIFPEVVKSTGMGSAVCSTTGVKVDLAETLVIKFAQETEYTIRLGKDNRTIVVVVPRTKSESAGPTDDKAGQEAPQQEMAPADLFMSGRAALAGGDNVKAIELFNRLLLLPLNEYSQEAQELIGLSREKNGEVAKAKAEYQLYLKLYPDGEGAARVKQRLAALEAIKEEVGEAKPIEKQRKAVREVHQNTVTGGISQYYYGGKSQTNSDTAGTETNTNLTEQSSLITNLDATARFRHNQYDTKIVFRDTQTHNFMPDVADKNTLSAAYVEHENKLLDYMFRLGRHSGTSQGVLGRFDGGFVRYGINDKWRITAVAGQPDYGSQSSIETVRHFYGAAAEFGPLGEKWSGNIFAIQQVADGMAERRAIGTEMRYFSGTTSWFGWLDYDILYDAVNIAMLQGNWRTDSGYNFNMLLDHRKSPILIAETAIPSVPGATSVSDLRKVLSDDEIRKRVKQLTPDSDMAMIGVTKQVTDRWQLGGDVRVNRTSSTEGAGVVPPQDSTGNIFTYTVQATGTSILFKNDTSVVTASYVDDPQYNSQNISFANSATFRENWRVDSSLGYYHEKQGEARTWKVMPTIRLAYQWKDNMSFETELSVERSHTDDPSSDSRIDYWRETIFAGYRWDFR